MRLAEESKIGGMILVGAYTSDLGYPSEKKSGVYLARTENAVKIRFKSLSRRRKRERADSVNSASGCC